ncbi:hypothetical protein [Duganella sp. Dugasp56]|uniref:hypothetical protein n=1 Tax=Duganella sp. Dugasp56 TaxID=3243046 RepID=UPI0039AF00E4
MNISTLGPFALANDHLQDLVHHPNPDIFKKAVLASSMRDRESLVRLWLTEGIPYAFKNSAGTYDEMREWLAARLMVHIKDVTLVGSGRIGFSMKPLFFGREFNKSSDLDLTIVNLALFQNCQADAAKFANDFSNKLISPNNEKQETYWKDTILRLPNIAKFGFVDTSQFPGNENYLSIRNVNDTMSRLQKRLEKTKGVPAPKKITARIYRDWNALIRRVSFNLESARKELSKPLDVVE